MKRDFRSEYSAQDSVKHIPKHPDKSNPPEVLAAPLGNQDDCLLSDLVGQRPIA